MSVDTHTLAPSAATCDVWVVFDSSSVRTDYWSTQYRWIGKECNLPDPGVYAIVGMAAFLGGSGRITVFLATMMVELTDDASLIAPVGIVCIISMGKSMMQAIHQLLVNLRDCLTDCL